MKPALKPGLLPVWRNRDTLQIGIDPRRAIALTGMRHVAGLLSLLDGSRDRSQVLAAAGELGIDSQAADQVIALLAAGGVLHDFPVTAYRALPAALRARLGPELATAALAHGDDDGGARVLARRQVACVNVQGTGRVGLCVASLLASAGIGTVISTGPALAQPGMAQPATPAGPQTPAPPMAEGTGGSRSDTRPRRRPDLVIIVDSHRRDLPTALTRARIPHLAIHASEAIGVVGPLVLPGRSACLRCMDLTRAERDPAWPLVLAQLTSRTADPPACDAVLATAAAAQATAQALAFIDRGAPAVAVISATLELVLPGWQWRRRSWQPHDRCHCGTRCGM